jgi:hypothetical protein
MEKLARFVDKEVKIRVNLIIVSAHVLERISQVANTGIMRSDNPTGERRNRGDKDHPSLPVIPHSQGDPLRQHKGSAQVDVNGLVPLLQADLFQALVGPRASVTDQNIDRAKLGLRRIQQRQHLS